MNGPDRATEEAFKFTVSDSASFLTPYKLILKSDNDGQLHFPLLGIISYSRLCSNRERKRRVVRLRFNGKYIFGGFPFYHIKHLTGLHGVS